MTGSFSAPTAFGLQYGRFLANYDIGRIPIAVPHNAALRFGFERDDLTPPVPLVDDSRQNMLSLVCSDRLPLSEAEREPVDVVMAGGPEDRFVPAWERIRGALDAVDGRYSIGNSNRMEKLHSVVSLLDDDGLKYAARAMIGEHDAALLALEMERGSDRASGLVGKRLSVAAASWLNFARNCAFAGSFKRHALSLSTFHSWHAGLWHVAELSLLTSAQFYSGIGRFETAAHDRLRAGMAHLMRERHSLSIVARHLEEALKNFEWVKPAPSCALITEAEELKDRAGSAGDGGGDK